MGAFEGLTLVIPERPDVERAAVAAAWRAGGGTVVRLDRFWEPPALDPVRTRLYGWDLFCQVAAQKVGIQLFAPPDDLLAALDGTWLGRTVALTEAPALPEARFPCFVKSVVPKVIASRVYTSREELLGVIGPTEAGEQFLASDIVAFTAEVRAFVHGDAVLTVAQYEGHPVDIGGARLLAERFARANAPAPAYVLDVGLVEARWVVVELNAAWGAGLNGCDAAGAALCIRDAAAAEPAR